MRSLFKKFKNIIFKYKYSKASPNKRAEMMKGILYHIGKDVELYTSSFGTEPYLISIGDKVTVASSVKFITHDVSCFNMASYLGIDRKFMDKVGSIVLHDNCFIGAHSILLPNTSIGKNSVIAAGSVVKGIIPDNEVWGGNPAKFIMKTEHLANKTLQLSKSYPWKYDDSGNMLTVSQAQLIKMRQDYLFKKERDKRALIQKE